METWKIRDIPNETDPATIKICSLCSEKFRITKLCTDTCPKCSHFPDRKEKITAYEFHTKKPSRPAFIDKQNEWKKTYRKNKLTSRY